MRRALLGWVVVGCGTAAGPKVEVPPPVPVEAPPPAPMTTFDREGFSLAGAEYWPYVGEREPDYPAEILWGFYPEAGVTPPGEDEPNPASATPAAIACAEVAYAALWRFLAAPPAALRDVAARGAASGYTNRFYLWVNDYSRAVSPFPGEQRPGKLWYWKRKIADPTRPAGFWKWESSLTQAGVCEVPQPAQIAEALAEAQAKVDAAAVATPPEGLRLPTDLAVRSYRPTLRIDPRQTTFTGEIEIDATLLGPTRVVWLHAEALRIDSARVERPGGAAIAMTPVLDEPGERVALVAAEPLPAGALTLRVAFRGVLEPNDSRGVFRQDSGGEPYVFTQFQATDARRAWPCVDEPDRKVPWRLVLEVPEGQLAVSNTPAASEVAAGGTPGWTRVTFLPTEPLPSYLVAFAIGPFDVRPAGTSDGGVAMRVLTPRGRAAEGATAATLIPRLLAAAEAYLGTPYPFSKLDAVAVPTTIDFGAMEHPGLVTYGERLLLLPEPAPPTRRRRLASYVAHELAHMWFGNLVTPRWWDDLWLAEAFSSWLPARLLAEVLPTEAHPDDLAAERADALAADALVSARAVRQPIATAADIGDAFDAITYDKGAALLHMLERWIGEPAMQAGVRAYLTRHAYSTATAKDFLAAAQAAAGRDVATPLATFLDQPGAPRLEVQLACDGGRAQATLRQRRYVPLGAAPSADQPRWQVPACLAIGRGRTREELCVVVDRDEVVVPLPGDGCVDWLHPNAGGTGYYRAAPVGGWGPLLGPAWSRLTPAERLAAVDDLGAQVAAGEVDVAVWLGALAQLAREGTPAALAHVATAVGELEPYWPTSPKARAYLGKVIAPVARKLGWVARGRADDARAERTRAALVPLAAELAGDRALLAQAGKLAANPSTIPASVRADVLAVALRADATRFEPLLAALRQATEPGVRDDLYAALGSVRDPARLDAALALVLDPALDPREATSAIDAAIATPASRAAAQAFVAANADAILARLPSSLAYVVVGWLAEGCDVPAPSVAADLATRFAAVRGHARVIAETLEARSQCAAWRGHIEPGLARWASP